MSPRQSFIESLPVARRVVRRDGITLHLIRYWSDVLTTSMGKSQKVGVRYDPRDLSRVYLQMPDGDYLDLSYRDLSRPPISLREQQLALKHLRKVKHVDVNEEAIFQAAKSMRESEDEARIKSKNVGRCCTRVLQRAQQGPAEPVAHSSPQKSTRPAGRQGMTRRQPWRRMLTVEEWS
jgi:putative transposase